jgi:hypothetical protein
MNPVVITAFKSKAQLLRQLAAELKLQIEETEITGKDDLVRFSFGELDDATTQKLVHAVPRDVYAYRGTITG